MGAKHIGFIMDGHGRRALAHGMSRAEGYAHGLVALYRVAKRCSERGVEAVSVYALSTENLNRPEEELQAIFKVVEKFNLTYDGDYKISYMGDFDSLDDKLSSSIEQVEEKTRDNEGMWLNIAFNYGGRSELVRAFQSLLAKGKNGGTVTEDDISREMYTADCGDPDLIIRTGGDIRISNFLLWQAAYAELYFTDVLWPDFNEKELDKAIENFYSRKRRYGGV